MAMTMMKSSLHFQGMLGRPDWPWLLRVTPWFIGLPGPPDDSLNVPLEGGLLGPVPLISAIFGSAGTGSEGACNFGPFFPSVLKLPTTICGHKNEKLKNS
uniref:Uncharacterized protein n=1 Tax=Oryza brachyantha TaxID=4533 RepID=J3MYR4_ORYBR